MVTFNPIFREANRTRCRYRILYGGAGSGKSYNVAQDFILKLSEERYRGANLLVIRRSEKSNRYSTFAELCGAINRIFGEEAGRYWKIKTDPMELCCISTGASILFRGMMDSTQRERVKSVSFPHGKLTFIWCEEATELSDGDLDILDDRLRGDLGGVNPELYYQITMTFNPISASHWLKRRFFDCGADSDVYILRSVFGDNRFIDREYSDRMERRRRLDPEGYAVYGLGEWGGLGEGLILPNFEVAEVTGEFRRRCLSQDFGYNHADCILEVGERDGDLYVIRELYVRGLDTGEIISRAAAEGFSKELMMYCDSAEPDRIKTWRTAGYRAVPVRKGSGSVSSQIDFLKGRKLFVDPSCEGLIAELREWRWTRDPVSGRFTDIPAASADDAIAALRYSVDHFRTRGGVMGKDLLGL